MNTHTVQPAALEWLKSAKHLCELGGERTYTFRQMCPAFGLDDDEKAPILRKIANLNRQMAVETKRMTEIEVRAPSPIGARALLGDDVPAAVRGGLAALVVGSLSAVVANEIAQVEDLIDLAAGHDAEAALQLRMAFRGDGLLRAHCVLDGRNAVGLHKCSVDLKESAFNTCLALPPDEQEAVLEKHELQGWLSR